MTDSAPEPRLRLQTAPKPRVDAWKPWTAYALIAANVGMFAFELVRGASITGPTTEQMVAVGANFAPLTCEGQAWRLVTAMFLHYGIVHIGMNMVCLYQVRVVERMLGRAAFFAVYMASGLIGGLASIAIHPLGVSAGASGAVFGMFGAFTAVMVARRSTIEPAAWQRTMQSLGTFFVINLLFGLSQSGIDLSAHIAGLVVGFAATFALEKTDGPDAHRVLRALIVGLIGAGVAFGGLQALPH